MTDRLEIAMNTIRDDLKPEFKEFLERVESVYESIYYMDYNDFDAYIKEKGRYGMSSEMKRKFRKFLKPKKKEIKNG